MQVNIKKYNLYSEDLDIAKTLSECGVYLKKHINFLNEKKNYAVKCINSQLKVKDDIMLEMQEIFKKMPSTELEGKNCAIQLNQKNQFHTNFTETCLEEVSSE